MPLVLSLCDSSQDWSDVIVAVAWVIAMFTVALGIWTAKMLMSNQS